MSKNLDIGILIIEISNRCESILKKEINTKTNDSSAAIIAYYLSIIEYTKSVGLLVKEENYILIPHVCRSVLEAGIDILNLIKDSNYYYVLKKISFQANKKRAESWRINKSNPLHPNINELPSDFNDSENTRNKKLKEIDKIVKESFPNNITELKVRFRKANLEDLYESIYWLTSPEIHNDLSIVWDRHIEERDGHAIFHTKPKAGIDGYSPHIDLIITYLIAFLGEIIVFLENKNFTNYFLELEIIKKEISKLMA